MCFSAHQTHYEQFGAITGVVNAGTLGEHHIKVRGVRDHSYGEIYLYLHVLIKCI